jgi:hypothetical protein
VNGGELIGLAGVVSGAAVSIVTVVLTHELKRRDRLRADEKERLADLRAVLESAAGAVSEAIGAARQRVVAQEASDRKETGTTFMGKIEAVELFEKRIAIRRGSDDDVTGAYGNALTQLDLVSKEFYDAHGALDQDAQRRANDLIDDASGALRSYLDSARAALDD